MATTTHEIAAAPRHRPTPLLRVATLPWPRLALGAVLALAAMLNFWALDQPGLRQQLLRRRRQEHAAELAQLLLCLLRSGRLRHASTSRRWASGSRRPAPSCSASHGCQPPAARGAGRRRSPSPCSTVWSRRVVGPRCRPAGGAGPGRDAGQRRHQPQQHHRQPAGADGAAGGVGGAQAPPRRAGCAGCCCAPCWSGSASTSRCCEAYLVAPGLRPGLPAGRAGTAGCKRIGHLALAAVVLLAVSLSWAAAVDLTPASAASLRRLQRDQLRAEPGARLQRAAAPARAAAGTPGGGGGRRRTRCSTAARPASSACWARRWAAR